jgi:hypothetical protein
MTASPKTSESTNKPKAYAVNMAPEEFDAFIERAFSVRKQQRTSTLSAHETKLIKRINRGLPAEFCKRHALLTGRRKKRVLTAQEKQELLELTHQVEMRDGERAAALLELANLRRLPVRLLMKQMGIQAAPIHR